MKKTIYKIKSIEINGAKSIENSLIINYYPQTIKTLKNEAHKKDMIYNSKVKAIYGPNGSGKTAFIEAVMLYKTIVYETSIVSLNELFKTFINKNSNIFEITIKFVSINLEGKTNKQKSFEHHIKIEKSRDEFIISEEKISEGPNCIYDFDNNNSDLKKYQSITKMFINAVRDDSSNAEFKKKLTFYGIVKGKESAVYNCIDFSRRITIINDEKDDHSFYNFKKNNSSTESDYIEENYKKYSVKQKINFDHDRRKYENRIILNKEFIEKFEDELNRKTMFLKLFKPEIDKITYEKQEEKDYYIIKIQCQYEKYKIDLELESAGIKKLLNLEDALYNLKKGNIVFFDEYDSHLHDFACSKILEHIFYDTTGQFTFTTHNSFLMDIISSENNSIDIINVKNEVYTFKKNGNRVPSIINKLGNFNKDNYYNIDYLGALYE